jgi:hypothetical protein
VVESFVGSGLKWYLPKPLEKAVTPSTPMVTTQGNSAITEVQSIFAQALRSLKDAESLSLDRSREIDLKLNAVQAKLDELIYQNPAPNPLRNSQAAEKLRSDLIAIQSLLASDRVESTKVDSATNRSFDQLNEALDLAKKNLPIASATTVDITNLIRENAIRLASERVRPYTIAAEASYQRFLRQLPAGIPSESTKQQTPTLARAGRELVTDRIPQRGFALKKGKVSGQSTIGEMSLPTEILISSVRLKRQDSNMVQISWKASKEAAPETTCKIGPSIGTDNSISHLLNLVQKEGDFEIALQVRYEPIGRDISISFPLCEMLDDKLGLDPGFVMAFKGICEKQKLELLARSQCSIEIPSIAESTTWIVDDDVNEKIHSATDEALNQCLTARQQAWLHQTQSEYTSSKHLLESRKLAFEEERNFRHSTWLDTLKAMESKLNSIDRAARNNVSRDSSVVR